MTLVKYRFVVHNSYVLASCRTAVVYYHVLFSVVSEVTVFFGAKPLNPFKEKSA